MKIGILSDSHLVSEEVILKNNAYRILLNKLKLIFKDVDLIIHAGDICCLEFINDLEKIAPINAVRGNMDSFTNCKSFPKILSLEFNGVKIGIAHSIEDLSHFEKNEINIFIFGHSHISMMKTNENGILLINPGSLTRPKIIQKKYLFEQETKPRPSTAFLHIEDGLISSFIKRM